jgi:adenosylcobinamide kinase/adenosylcobinamide-phosphate guanylyltransferase
VVDCLTLWLSNLLLAGANETQMDERIGELLDVMETMTASVVLVTNEVGMGIVPDNALSRSFRDAAGRAHQRLGAAADEVYFAALGQMLRLKPGPVEAA